MAVIESMELAQVLAEAGDIARNVNQRLTSAHLLLAFFVVPNRAEMLLRERGVDEDRILLAMPGAPEEPEGLERDLRERARQVAEGLRADETDCIHLLIAMTRVRQCSAHQLLAACGLELAALRNVALSYYTAGMPRRLRQVPQPATRAPLGQKASMDPWSHFPSSIALFQRNLERMARDREELVEEIRVTLLHEVGHFLGLDEDQLRDLGLD